MPKKKQHESLRAPAARAPAAGPGDAHVMTTRIDPPHVIAGADSQSADDRAAAAPLALSALASAAAEELPAAEPALWQFAAPSSEGVAFEQMQNQAAQLAAQLSKQQLALDHREAEINARAAAVENQVRNARLWLSEKLEMLARSRDASWTSDEAFARLADGARSLDSSAFASPAADDPAMPLSRAAQAWRQERWQEQFEQWRAEREAGLETKSSHSTESPSGQPGEATGHPPAVPVYRRKEAEERLQATEQRLAARAAELEAKRAELLADRQALEAQREAFHVQRQEERWRLAEQRRTMSEKLMRQRARLRRRRDDFDARETALRQLRADLLRAQQQTLEMRLAAEELWARARGKGSAADAGAARGSSPGAADADQHAA